MISPRVPHLHGIHDDGDGQRRRPYSPPILKKSNCLPQKHLKSIKKVTYGTFYLKIGTFSCLMKLNGVTKSASDLSSEDGKVAPE